MLKFNLIKNLIRFLLPHRSKTCLSFCVHSANFEKITNKNDRSRKRDRRPATVKVVYDLFDLIRVKISHFEKSQNIHFSVCLCVTGLFQLQAPGPFITWQKSNTKNDREYSTRDKNNSFTWHRPQRKTTRGQNWRENRSQTSALVLQPCTTLWVKYDF